ncbi:MAG: 50S ribosomal protein L4 [Candidatus Zambryskibacteria bacterium]|nr:50S ribosomal protein L4 [Candidatus Zambryskibacteria bacterium]
MEVTIHNIKGEKVRTINLPENVFAVRWNADLVKQVVDSMLSSVRIPVAHTKNRGEVRGGGRKPWQQKGTGRARHGSTRSPIWRHGGVAHGPRNEKNFLRKVSKKMKTKALYAILSRKFKEGEIIFVDSLKPSAAKTKEGVKALKGFSNILSKKRNAAVLALAEKNRETERAYRNIGNIEIIEARNLNPLSLLRYKYLVMENPQLWLKQK